METHIWPYVATSLFINYLEDFSLYLNIAEKGRVVLCTYETMEEVKYISIELHRLEWPSAQSRLFRALTIYIFEYLWWWRYHSLQGKPVPVVNDPH